MQRLIIYLLIFFPGLLTGQNLNERINQLLEQMTLQEKVHQLTHDTYFSTGDNSRLGIPGFIMSDGPHGVRFGGATSFPVGIAMASTFNTDLIEEVGKAMGEEFWAYGKHQQLGPCVDLCRDPRNGRSAETAGEDPFLAGEVGAAYVKGIQQTPVAATVKHFNLVNRQDYRHSSHATINERWLMEHYGENFRKTIQEGGVLSVMNAYNLVNGVHCSESPLLLNTILRQRWGYPFYVVSDWGAVYNAKNALIAGTEICMASDHYANDISGLIASGQLSEERLDTAVSRVLRTKLLNGMLDYYPRAESGLIDSPEHRELCHKAGQEAIILLKNEDQILPIDKNQVTNIAVIGPNASVMQTDGFGSSWVDVIYSVSPVEGIQNAIGNSKVTYVKGCEINSTSTTGFNAALTAADQADYVIFVGGLDQTQEGEGYGEGSDRKSGSVDLPGVQQDLINALAARNSNLIVAINSGGICGVNRSITNIKGLIYAFYPGQEGGNAMADVIFGDYNPGGRLPVTMPKTDAQLPPRNDNFNDDYGCGYRWYDEMNTTPEFAFGFGLSYTTFDYSNLTVSSVSSAVGTPVTISVDVTNTGEIAGDEVVQLYLTDESASFWMPEKQLKGFQRIHLNAGETRTITFTLMAEDFYHWDEASDSYQIEAGQFTVKVGGSSDNLPISASFESIPATGQPDLKVTSMFTLPRYPVEGTEVHFYALVKNLGTAPTTMEDMHHIQFIVDGENISSASKSGIIIPPGGMALLESDQGSWIPNQDGQYVIEGRVNPDNTINEISTSNNSASLPVKVIDAETDLLSNNLALNKPIASTSNEAPDLSAEKAVDGNLNTRWASQWSDPHALMVDLQDLYDIKAIHVTWEAAYASRYKIEVSTDRQAWTTVVSETNGNGGKDEWPVNESASYRYVKITGLQRATEWGYSIYELEVFGLSISTGIHRIKEERLRVSPNPTSSTLYVSQLSEGAIVSIFNAQGELQRNLEVRNGCIDVSGLEDGLYVLQNKNTKGKFVKRR